MSEPPSSLVFRHRSPDVGRRELGAFLRDLTVQLGNGRSVTCLVTTDAEVRDLNRRFRRKDSTTDVLSFPSGNAASLGDLAISFERARAQAAEFGHGVEDELRILILHGMLHLAGMDHESDAGEMARAEARWRKRLGLPVGLIERVER